MATTDLTSVGEVRATSGDGAIPPTIDRTRNISGGMLMMIFFIGSEVMLFASFFAAYFFARYNIADNDWPPLNQAGEPFKLPVLLTGVNTAVLVASSFTLHWAEHRLKLGDRKGLQVGMIVTMLLGAAFLIVQLNEYWHLGFTPSDTAFGSTFYALTGLHGAHVAVGLLILLVMYIRITRANDFSAKFATPLAAGSLYWHFVDVVWVILFLLVYVL